MTETQKPDKSWKKNKTYRTPKKPSKETQNPDAEKSFGIVKFIPINGNPALYSSAPVVAPAFSVSQLHEIYLVENISITGKSYLRLEIDNFPDAVGECVRRMKEQSNINYTTEMG